MDKSHSQDNRTALVYDERMVEHECLWDPEYPESPDRFSFSLQKCRDYGLVERCHIIPAVPAKEAQILTMHKKSYLDLFKTTDGNENEKFLEEMSSRYDSVYFHPKTYDLSLLAAGSTINLISTVASEKAQNGMAIIRPPGHHAMEEEFCGYCFFNNVALGARHVLDNFSIKKILIVDWDVHHGQATQYMFYDDPRVLYFSIHRYEHGAYWPELRESNYDYVGIGQGKGFNVNLPLNKTGMGDSDYLAIFNNVLLPIAYEYNPELIIVSAGYDAAFGCPEGEMVVTPACYATMVHSLMGLAQGKVCVILEGGYFIKSLSEGVAMTLRTLLGDPCPSLGPLPPPCDSVVESILNCISAQRPYWRSLAFQGDFSKENQEDSKIHVPEIKYRGQLGLKRPDSFPTRQYYAKHSESKMEELTKEFEIIMSKVNLKIPLHRVCLAFDPDMAMHQSILEKLHPERPDRILKIFEKLKEFGLLEKCHKLTSRRCTEDEIKLAHTPEYVECMKQSQFATPASLVKLQENYKSIYLCKASYDCATLAVGCLLQVVDSVLDGISLSGTAIVRPPGHHAELGEACGFCIFNNVSIAARYALKKYSLKRILILDWDIHHGNGTQHQFENDPRVLYLSLHRYDNSLFFPFSYDANYTFVGSNEGEGFNVNIPWNKGRMGDGDYIAAFFQIVLPIAQNFDPELVIVSSGFDGARGDPLGGCSISPEAYGHMTHLIKSLANGKIILALEGGYNIPIISECMAHCVKALLGYPIPQLRDDLKPCKSAVKSICHAVETHSKYWSSLKFLVDLPEFGFAKPESRNSPEAFDVDFFKHKLNIATEGATGGHETLTLEIPQQMYAIEPLTWCPHLSTVHLLPVDGLDPKTVCESCYDVSENWVCLTCYKVFCGRYVKKHMLEHHRETGHSITLSYTDLSIWCYVCDSYVDNKDLDFAKDEVYIKKFGVSRLSVS